MQVSIKVVIATLLITTTIAAMICALIPPIIHLQDDAMDLVVNSATSTGGSLQFALAAQLRRVGTSCNTLYKAASSRDLLTPNGVLEPWQFLAWTSGLIADNGYSISLIRPDGRGYVLAPYSTVVDGSALPGYVFISRITDPGVGMDYGFFRVGVPPTPANLTSPWTNLSTTVSWVDQPMYHKLISDVNRTSVMAWTSLSPRNSSRASSSLLSYGGHFTVPTAIDNASRTQILSINLRGEALSDFFSTVHISANGAALLLDASSGAFVAGNIDDPTGKKVNGTAELVHVRELQDSRVASLLRASVADGEVDSVSEALLTCTTPCMFTYWPHLNQLHVGRDIVSMGVIQYPFTSVYVSQVSDRTGQALDLRLVVVLPSNDVIGGLMKGIHRSFFIPAIALVVIACVVAAFVNVAFRDLTIIEATILGLAGRLFPHLRLFVASPPTPESRVVSDTSPPDVPSGTIQEFHRIASSIRVLTRELVTIRAFTVTPIHSVSLFNTPGASSDCIAELHDGSLNESQRQQAAPYRLIHRNLWRVPVTTVKADLSASFFGGPRRGDAQLLEIVQRDVLLIFQKQVQQCLGSIDEFSGDRIIIHFNALSRTPKHALAALMASLGCVKDVKVLSETNPQCKSRSLFVSQPVSIGIASGVATCGLLGPPRLRRFTVVSPSECQASFMARLAAVERQPILMTWRAAELARQQHDQRHTDGAVKVQPFAFVPIAKVVLSGEEAFS